MSKVKDDPRTLKIDAKVYHDLSKVKDFLKDSTSTNLTFSDTIRWLMEGSAQKLTEMIAHKIGLTSAANIAKGFRQAHDFEGFEASLTGLARLKQEQEKQKKKTSLQG